MMFLVMLVIAVSSMLARPTCRSPRLQPTAPVTFRDRRASFVLSGKGSIIMRLALLAAGRRRLFRPARPSPAFDDTGGRSEAGAAEKGCADRRTRAGEIDLSDEGASIAPKSANVAKFAVFLAQMSHELRTRPAQTPSSAFSEVMKERNLRRAMRVRGSTRNISRRHSQFGRASASISSMKFLDLSRIESRPV